MAVSLAAWRTRSSARDRAARHCVRTLVGWPELPLDSSLPSTTSAVAAWACLFFIAHESLCSAASLVLWNCPTPCVRASRSCPCGSPCGPCCDGQGQTQSLPSPAHDVSAHARGLRPRQVRVRLARVACPLLPSAWSERGGTQIGHFRAPYSACTFPCQRFTDPVTQARARLGARGVG